MGYFLRKFCFSLFQTALFTICIMTLCLSSPSDYLCPKKKITLLYSSLDIKTQHRFLLRRFSAKVWISFKCEGKNKQNELKLLYYIYYCMLIISSIVVNKKNPTNIIIHTCIIILIYTHYRYTYNLRKKYMPACLIV